MGNEFQTLGAICLGNKQDNFQLYRFITSENIAKSFTGGDYFFDSHSGA